MLGKLLRQVACSGVGSSIQIFQNLSSVNEEDWTIVAFKPLINHERIIITIIELIPFYKYVTAAKKSTAGML